MALVGVSVGGVIGCGGFRRRVLTSVIKSVRRSVRVGPGRGKLGKNSTESECRVLRCCGI